MDGRVKTLHPNIHGGLLAVRDNETHMAQANELGIQPIDFVVVNLYPFKETVSKPDVTFEDAIEKYRYRRSNNDSFCSEKNHEYVTVLVDPADYGAVLTELKENGEVSKGLKTKS
ncbi:hypothetical protein GCM10020331_015900 [Ectobacillus funiculus]